MLLSVLLPVRNNAATITAAIRSTLLAMPSDSELLVLDDGSTDQTLDRIRSARDSRIKVLSHADSAGVAISLNELLSEARGQFIARMDGDDLTLPHRFRLQHAAIGDSDAVFSPVIRFGRGMVPKPTPFLGLSPSAWDLALLIGNPGAHSTLFARRRSLSDLDGYRNCLAEDYDLWLRMACAGATVSRTSLPGLGLRIHPGQVTADVSWAKRAALELEWQQAYINLAQLMFRDQLDSELAGRVADVGTPEAKARLLAPVINERLTQLGAVDRLAIRLLSKRVGLQLASEDGQK